MRTLLIFAVVCVLAQPATAAVPETMSFQGVLRNESGTPVPDATYAVTFRLYHAATGGTELWTETQTLTTSGGLFDAVLGGVTPLTLTFDEPYWLGIQIEGDPELDPRTELTSVPYALRAKLGDLTLPYSGTTAAPGPAFEVTNDTESGISGKTWLSQLGAYGVRGKYALGSPWGALAYRDSASVWGLYTPNDAYIGGTLVMPDGGEGGRVLTVDQYGYSSWQPPLEFTLPYSDTTCVGGPAFEVSAYCGSGVNGITYFASPGSYGVRGIDNTGSIWGALAYEDPGERNAWGVYTNGSMYVGGTNFQYPNGAADGHVLTSDGSGRGTWQPPSEFALPYSDTTCVGGPAFEVTAYCGSGISGVTYFASPGAYGVLGTDNTGSLWSALAYEDPGERNTWGVYTTGDLYVGGTSIKYPIGAADGYVLTSNSTGNASWQPAVAGSDGDWTVAGDNMYSGALGNVGVGTTTPEEKLHVRDEVAGDVSYAVKLDNPSATAGTAVGVLFKVDGGLASETRGKGGLVYERTGTWNRGSFHFLQDSGISYANPDLADAVMTIDNNGRVGIGTTTPSEKLQVAGTVHSTTGGFRFPDGTLQTTAGAGLALPYTGSATTAGEVLDVSNDGTGTAIVGTHTLSGNLGRLGGPIDGVYGRSHVNSGAGVYAKHEGSGAAVHANAPGGIGVEASSGTGAGVWATTSSGDALHAITGDGRALYAEDSAGKTAILCDADYGAYASHPSGPSGYIASSTYGVHGEASASSAAGVHGKHNGTGVAVYANSPGGIAVEAQAGAGTGVWAVSTESDAIHAISSVGRALYAELGDGKTATLCDADYGVYASNPYGTSGYIAGNSRGLYGEASAGSAAGVYGKHNGTGVAVHANAPTGIAVEASSGSGPGVWATSSTGNAVHAISSAGYAGYFEGGIRTDGFEYPSGASNGYVLTSNSSGVGTWQPAPTDSDWVISGSNIYSGVSGRVGIGTSSPGSKLEVIGPARIRGVSWPASGAGLELHYSSSLHKGYIQVYDRDAATWGNLFLGAERVGIGDGTPEYKLDVYSTLEGAIEAQSTVGTAVDATGLTVGVRGGGATGVLGEGGSIGVHGSSAVNAGWFDGHVTIIGNTNTSGNLTVGGVLSKAGGMFKIDHPLDPENMYLQHSFVESPDMMNVYNGNTTLDPSGEAWIELPEWFEALNMDYRYQLTCIGEFAPVYVAEEISGNRFKIAGGPEGQKVSWQVTGIRHDKFAEANRIQVEVDK